MIFATEGYLSVQAGSGRGGSRQRRGRSRVRQHGQPTGSEVDVGCDPVGDLLLERRDLGAGVWWRRMYSSSSPRNLATPFLIGQAAPSARPQIVVPGMMPMLLARLQHDVEVFEPAAARLDPLHGLVEPGGSFAAGRALAAALVGEEAAGVVEIVDDAGLVVDHGHGGGAQAQAARLAQALEVERRVELVGRQAGPC